ncbi:MAG: DUF4974 domain-containing protein [Sphingobacteriales bacterium]|nr:DUF4974 domain-containing protein [Sphingobacteriales bacterium]OJV98438.1 MAG: hypothetical protein BGO52_11665 [Sphingobacteriales bacterium 44-61]
MEKGNRQPKDIKLAYRVAYLLAGYIKQTLSDEELLELEAWKSESDHNRNLFSELTDENEIQQSLNEFSKPDTEGYLQKSKEHLSSLRRKRSIRIWSYAAAACIAFIVFLFIYYTPFSKTNSADLVEINAKDIQPGTTYATLTLANGKIIVLDTSQTDTAKNGQFIIHGKKGELEYNHSQTVSEYHTLTVPRKGVYKLVLPDGSRVWLNSESSIQYPTAFTGTERKVFVTGETYFEVAPDKQKPFRVVAEKFVVEALGTAFNINTYLNEPTDLTTLVEGAVRLTFKKGSEILKPGEQLKLSENSVEILNPDIGSAVAWKNDQFKFTNTPIDAIMRQVARWYDAEIVYQDKVTVDLNATIERNVPLSKLLYLLSKTDEVHFKIDGKKIIVTK